MVRPGGIQNFKIRRKILLIITVNTKNKCLGTYNEKIYAPLHIITITLDCYKYPQSILDNAWIRWGVSTKDDYSSWKIPSKYFTSTETIVHQDSLNTKINLKKFGKKLKNKLIIVLKCVKLNL